MHSWNMFIARCPSFHRLWAAKITLSSLAALHSRCTQSYSGGAVSAALPGRRSRRRHMHENVSAPGPFRVDRSGCTQRNRCAVSRQSFSTASSLVVHSSKSKAVPRSGAIRGISHRRLKSSKESGKTTAVSKVATIATASTCAETTVDLVATAAVELTKKVPVKRKPASKATPSKKAKTVRSSATAATSKAAESKSTLEVESVNDSTSVQANVDIAATTAAVKLTRKAPAKRKSASKATPSKKARTLKSTASMSDSKESSLSGDSVETEAEKEGLFSFPFYGKCNGESADYTAEDEAKAQVKTSKESFQVTRVDSGAGRYYRISVGGETYDLPSVTSVLGDTRPRNSSFGLSVWRKSMIKEHGEEGYHRLRTERMQAGTTFHQELESRLLENKAGLISIKPHSVEQAGGKPLQSLASFSSPPLSTSQDLNSFPHIYQGSTQTLKQFELEKNAMTGTFRDDEYSKVVKVCVGKEEEEKEEMKEKEETEEEEEEEEEGPEQVVSDCEQMLLDTLKSSGLLRSVQHVLEHVSDVRAVETIVTHLPLGYTGTCDCIAKYKGELCVIDWKTSSRPRPSLSLTYDSPVQAAAYAGAVNQDPHYPFKVSHTLIVVAYPTGEPAHAHFLSREKCQEFWWQWLARVEQYQTQFAADLSQVHFDDNDV